MECNCKKFKVNWKTLRLSCVSCGLISEHLKVVFRCHPTIPGRMFPQILDTKEL